MLTHDNYFSIEMNQKYMSASQFKTFQDCPARALAELSGEYIRENTTSLLVGSYVDAYFEGTLDLFKVENPDIFLKKGTGLKSEYRQADEIIKRLESDDLFMKYMSGQKQVIQTGNIGTVDFKIKIDVLHPGKAIVDLKIIKDFESMFNSKIAKRQNFVEFWGYDLQGAVYQEIERQNRGVDAEPLPFFIAAATKEKVTDFAIIHVPQVYLDAQLDIVRTWASLYQRMKVSVAEKSERCEKCDYCKMTKRLINVISLDDIAC